MDSARGRAPLTLAAPAKINLYLGVHAQTDSQGYHRVDSVMAALALADRVELEAADGLCVQMEPEADLEPQRNSAWRAAEALGRALGREPRVRIRIYKRIPIQAGLGGPSTDAAAVLRGLCELWDVSLCDPRVEAVARAVGADVPFFLGASPAYLAGRGDALQETFSLDAPLQLALVKPLEGRVSTPAAYREFDLRPQSAPPLEPLLEALRDGRADALPALVANNLGPAACALEPRIAEVLAWLHAQEGVLAAEVCGSGACSFAVCADADAAKRVAARAAADGRWWSCATGTIPGTR